MESYLLIEKKYIDNSFLMKEPLLGLMSKERCPNCSFRLYMNSLCNIWCPECGFKENIEKTIGR